MIFTYHVPFLHTNPPLWLIHHFINQLLSGEYDQTREHIERSTLLYFCHHKICPLSKTDFFFFRYLERKVMNEAFCQSLHSNTGWSSADTKENLFLEYGYIPMRTDFVIKRLQSNHLSPGEQIAPQEMVRAGTQHLLLLLTRQILSS